MLKLQNLTVVYPDATKAIDDVSFRVGKGEGVALIGENGAGKTTLLLAMVGILEASGTLEVDGLALGLKSVREIRNRVGLVFQNPDDQLFSPMVYDDVAFGCRNLGLPEGEVKARVNDALRKLNISHLGGRSSLKLSGGEKRMAAIATVLAMKPSVLLFDEPTAFLDPKARRALSHSLKGLPQTKLVATHDMAFAAETCGRVVALKGGRVVADGGTSLLYDEGLMRGCGLEAIKETSLRLGSKA